MAVENNKAGCSCLGCIAPIGIALVIMAIIGSVSDGSSSHSGDVESEFACEKAVKKQLKAPSTAKFHSDTKKWRKAGTSSEQSTLRTASGPPSAPITAAASLKMTTTTGFSVTCPSAIAERTLFAVGH